MSDNILVTGSAGFFGEWVIPALEGAGYNVIPYDIVDGDDVGNRRRLAGRLRSCLGVVHLAGVGMLAKGQDYGWHHATIYETFTSTFLTFVASRSATHFIHMSSGAIYGFGPEQMNGWLTENDMPISELLIPDTQARIDMLNAYSKNKWEIEEYLSNADLKTKVAVSLRVNCIEPHNAGAVQRGDHWGWWCSQRLVCDAILAGLRRQESGFFPVNVGEDNPNLDKENLTELLRS